MADQLAPPFPSRRKLAFALAGVAVAGLARETVAQTPAPSSERPPAPRSEFAFEILADIAPTLDLGEGPLGHRRMVPVLGGVFEGPRIRGKVLPGGADRQLVRKDGVTELHAIYELQTDDGAILGVENRVKVYAPPGEPRYAFSHIDITAPDGPHAWLNRSVFIGTLVPLMPARQAVRVTFYRLV